FAQGEHFRRPEHAPQRPRMTQDERESFGLPRFRRPLGAVPAADGKIAPRVVFQQVAEKSQTGEGNGIWGCCGGRGHGLLLFCTTYPSFPRGAWERERCTRIPELLSTRPTRPSALFAVWAGASSAGAARNTVRDSAGPAFPERS